MYKYRSFLEKTWLLSHAPNRRAVGERIPLVSGVLYFSPQKQTAILLTVPRPRLRRFYPKAQTNISPKNRHKRANLFPRTFSERRVKHKGTAAVRTTLRRLTGTDPRGTARSCCSRPPSSTPRRHLGAHRPFRRAADAPSRPPQCHSSLRTAGPSDRLSAATCRCSKQITLSINCTMCL